MTRRKTALVAAAGALAASGTAIAVTQTEAPAPKAYVIAEINVHDPAGYETYKARIAPVVAAHGGRYLARGGQVQAVEGAPPSGRIVIIEFPNVEAARAFEVAPDHRAAAAIRHQAAESRVYLVEGAPQ